uniref:Uncharacterized protein n=1 Tax=Molossus molossus TaxID=27622 RepID=A0A7J8GR55_MOLMO|nr:hypothetical protein HJG59_011401 [Molossus molossus]
MATASPCARGLNELVPMQDRLLGCSRWASLTAPLPAGASGETLKSRLDISMTKGGHLGTLHAGQTCSVSPCCSEEAAGLRSACNQAARAVPRVDGQCSRRLPQKCPQGPWREQTPRASRPPAGRLLGGIMSPYHSEPFP